MNSLIRTSARKSLRQFSTSSIKFNSQQIIASEEQALKSAPLVALHERLNLPSSYKLGTLAQALTCRSSYKQELAHNYGLNILGKNFLTYYVSEHILATYPRLPLPVLNAAVASYISSDSLYAVGKYAWGIESDDTTALSKYLNEEAKEHSLGKLRFLPISQTDEAGVTKLSSRDRKSIHPAAAYALGVRSIIGGLYLSTKSEEVTKKFIQDHILSRKLDISKMFEFEQPTRELSRLCERQNLEKPVARLISETGRKSDKPIFVMGIFSGENKLGESYGSSIREAKIRASVNALKNWYLYKPTTVSVPSDKDYKPSVVDHGIVIV
ncbi:hypothetical protein WICPIJ_001860 [Wickerhamomyces pijperi]|uniref:Large ribosomal subunit protein mL44 n=1 Tax=Wickerhamomyces pijperi TaxID=599730 RepID=A0A9P8QCS2_WICPI|nr:hypothetical protein WICPIJ_001860 [Wickerhamomyces pijperi]